MPNEVNINIIFIFSNGFSIWILILILLRLQAFLYSLRAMRSIYPTSHHHTPLVFMICHMTKDTTIIAFFPFLEVIFPYSKIRVSCATGISDLYFGCTPLLSVLPLYLIVLKLFNRVHICTRTSFTAFLFHIGVSGRR